MLENEEFYKKIVKPYLIKKGFHIQKIDLPGVPDLIISKNNKVLRAEMKVVKVKSNSNIITPKWEQGQLAWIMDYIKYNPEGVCLILGYNGKMFFLPPKKIYNMEELIWNTNYLNKWNA